MADEKDVPGDDVPENPDPPKKPGFFKRMMGKGEELQERRISKSALYKIIKEELEVVLTNEEASEMFDLDMSALLDEMMNEEEKDEKGYERPLESGLAEEKDENWIQDAEEDIERRGTEGVCTGEKFGSESCPPGSKRYNLAKTFRKMAKKRKKD